MSFEKTKRKEVFVYHEILYEKTPTKKLLEITIDEHLKFKEHITNICKSVSGKLNPLS